MMLRFITLMLAGLYSLGICGQNKRVLIFENYEKGTVLFKNNTKTHTLLNFDAANDNIMFKQGNEEMILTNTNQVDTVYIAERKFIPIKNFFLECIHTQHGNIYVHWNLRNVYKGKKGAYGMTTQAKVESINTSQMNYGYYENQYVDVYELSNRNEYYLFVSNKHVMVKNAKSLLKIFPEHQDEIIKYMEDQKVDFMNTSKVILFLEYCLGL